MHSGVTTESIVEHVACDFCGTAESDAVVSQTDFVHRTTEEIFTIVRCRSCGLHYLNPRPTAAEIGRYYTERYPFHLARGTLRRFAADCAERAANGRLYRLFALVPALTRRLSAHVRPPIDDPVRRHLPADRRARILDIGCGSGAVAHFWGRRGALLGYREIADVCGVEVDDEARAALAATGVTAYRDIVDVPQELRFDVIRMNWSLEHVHSPSRYFRFIADRLSAYGKAVVAVPNYEGLIYRVAPDCVEVPIHLYHYRRQDLLNFAGRCGLAEVEYRTFSYPGMYELAASLCPSLKGMFEQPLGLVGARRMQAVLSRFDALGLGNDMLFVFGRAA